ncbi:MAG: GDSL-type esterase/lipase family protein [Bacteroidales bacterium]|jgi:hypothetical protein|nr:GDSL-type esterase/lipase family protein [Bacteroidales bacterium]
MKPYKILIFILLCFLLLGFTSFIFPQDGINFGKITIKAPLLSEVFSQKEADLDVDATLDSLKKQAEMQQFKSLMDSLLYYKEFIYGNVAHIYFPKNDYKFLDKFFAVLESAKKSSRTVHITHYGDSQIEMDRISAYLRQQFQTFFGGSGAGMVPAIQTIPSVSVSQSYAGSMSRFVLYGSLKDSTNRRAGHRRYGMLANVVQVYGNGTITVGASSFKNAQPGTKTFKRLKLLLGHNSQPIYVTCKSQKRTLPATTGAAVLSWDFDQPVSRASITINGTAEIYGVSMEDSCGVTVDNVPMRGCSGTIFTGMDSATFANCMSLMNVRMVIMQYGGNMMPSIKTQKQISDYMANITRQIRYIQKINPKATILFIGPSDMSRRNKNGVLATWYLLPELNEALKKTALDNNVAYWDMFHVMGGENSMISWVKHQPALAGSDYIHFTSLGADRIATALWDAFWVNYRFYVLRKKVDPQIIQHVMSSNKNEKE